MRVMFLLGWLMALVVPPATVLAQPRVLIDTDFGTASEPVTPEHGAVDRITGVIAPPWSDNSGWAKVSVDYQPAEEEGRRFLRVSVSKFEDGRAQMMHHFPGQAEAGLYRLTFVARSPTRLNVQAGIRDYGPPWDFMWVQRLPLRDEWTTHAIDFQLDAYHRSVGFFLLLNGPGTLDLARMKLERLTRDEVIAELKAKYPGGGPKNLVRVSRFPLGLPTGWTLGNDDSDGDEVKVAADSFETRTDEMVTGPSSAPALKITAPGGTTLTSAPFSVPQPFDPHTASLYVLGSGSGKLEVLADGKVIASTPFDTKPESTGQRLAVMFTPQLLAKFHAVRLTGTGEFWIDALQVNVGNEATPYTSQTSDEVQLVLDSAARVQFDDEPARVKYCVTSSDPPTPDPRGFLRWRYAADAYAATRLAGITAAGNPTTQPAYTVPSSAPTTPAEHRRLCVRIVNARGRARELDALDLTANTKRRGDIAYDVFPDQPLGTFRIEAWVDNGSGEALSPVDEIVVHRVKRPRYWGKDAPHSPFGVHTNATTRHLLMAKSIGINWVRLHDAGTQYIGWHHLEKQPGQWTFRDDDINRYRAHHLKIFGAFSTAPTWASYFKKPHNGYFDQYYQPRRMEDFANYCRVVARRYRGVIDTYDVWNEPWIREWWAVGYDESKGADRLGYVASATPAADYARLMKTAYESAKAVDPNITVTGINTTTQDPGGPGEGRFGGREWTQMVAIDHDGLRWCDVIEYHQYVSGPVGFPGDGVEVGFKTATGPIVERLGKLPKPVWMSEGSAVREFIGNGLYHHTTLGRNDEDVLSTCDHHARHVLSLLACGNAKHFLYSMHGHGTFGAGGDWRTLVTDEGSLHPAGAAHAALAWHLEDARFVRVVEPAKDVFAYLFEATDGSRSVAVLSPRPNHAAYALPRGDGVERTDLFGNPLPAGAALGTTIVYVTRAGAAADALERTLQTHR